MTYLDYDRYDELVRRTVSQYVSPLVVSIGGHAVDGYVNLVLFFGPDATDPFEMSINYDDHEYKIADELIAEYSREIAVLMRQEGKIRKGPPAALIARLDIAGTSPSITLQPVSYDLVASTGLALDFPHRLFEQHGGTLRDYYLSDRAGPSIANSPFPTCLGVCGLLVVETDDGSEILVAERSSHLASLENTVGPSAAGHIDYSNQYRSLADVVEAGMRQEVREELNLKDDQFDVVPLAMATELFRGERPQLFCLVETTLGRKDIIDCLEAIPKSEREFASYRFVKLQGKTAQETEDWDGLNFEAQMNVTLLRDHLLQ